MPATASFRGRRRATRTGALKVCVLMGGLSSEREVSLRSGKAVATALGARGHEALSLVIDEEGEAALERLPSRTDCVFVALHGRFGEDGQVQRLLAARGIPYTGSGPQASARSFDKAWAKAILRAHGIPVARDVLLDSPFRARDVRDAIARAPGPRLVVKPVREGSSVGVSICRTLAEAARAAWRARSFAQPLLVEEFIAGRELTVAILGDEPLPPIEVVPALEFYDYRAKYDPTSGTRYRVHPEDLPFDTATRAQAVALASHRVLKCRDVSRVDIRVDESGRVLVLEVNTIPGLTGTSLLPKAALAAGIQFDELCERLVRSAIARSRIVHRGKK
ncbi:D-alanine--D-alanine ligase [bacterium]|nr:D-alanine--D-alanine ligase [bacterium]